MKKCATPKVANDNVLVAPSTRGAPLTQMNRAWLLLLILLVGYCEPPHDPTVYGKDPRYLDVYDDEEQVDGLLKIYAQQFSLDWLFAKAIVIKESHYRQFAISRSGAVGYMQLMPRWGSYTTQNYRNYMAARKQRRNAAGERIYKGLEARQWGRAYQQDLEQLLIDNGQDMNQLYAKESRFDPNFNIRSGTGQLAENYHFYRKRGHRDYVAMVLAASSYHAGRTPVTVKGAPRLDRIPINRGTEFYAADVMRTYKALKRVGNGRILKKDARVRMY